MAGDEDMNVVSSAMHWFSYARLNGQQFTDHAYYLWWHCRHGFVMPGGDAIRYTCAFITRKSVGGTTHGTMLMTYPWVPQMAKGMIVG
jgi:hypothetical protein